MVRRGSGFVRRRDHIRSDLGRMVLACFCTVLVLASGGGQLPAISTTTSDACDEVSTLSLQKKSPASEWSSVSRITKPPTAAGSNPAMSKNAWDDDV